MNNFVRSVFLIYILCVWFGKFSLYEKSIDRHEFIMKKYILHYFSVDETKAGSLPEGTLKPEDIDEDINKNIPIGFIYVQLLSEKSPAEIWPLMTWDDVSSAYADVFFGVTGGKDASFGQIQEDNIPQPKVLGDLNPTNRLARYIRSLICINRHTQYKSLPLINVPKLKLIPLNEHTPINRPTLINSPIWDDCTDWIQRGCLDTDFNPLQNKEVRKLNMDIRVWRRAG
jgi:hypothetical protein